MKLYATVTTDRASKGQGGNHQLETVYQAETDAGRVVVGRTIMTREEDGYRVRHIPVQGDTTEYRVPVKTECHHRDICISEDTYQCIRCERVERR